MTTIIKPMVFGALPGGLTRTRFFDGMALSQSHFENEQAYWRMKRQLTNRALGHGVVWGLRLEHDIARARFRLHPGYGLDCCGNDLIVCQTSEVLARDLLDGSPDVQALIALASGNGAPVRGCLLLEYVECPEDVLPVYNDACRPDAAFCQPSRVRESVRLRLVQPCSSTPSPVERFVEELTALQAEAPELFPAPPTPVPPTEHLPFAIHVQVGDREVAMHVDGGSGSAVIDMELSVPATDPTLDIDFELRPDFGWAVTAGKVESVEARPNSTPSTENPHGSTEIQTLWPSPAFGKIQSVTELSLPYALHLRWDARFKLSEPALSASGYHIVSPWTLTPLFSTVGAISGTQLVIAHDLRLRREGTRVRLRIALRALQVGDTTMPDVALPSPESDCLHGVNGLGLFLGATPSVQAAVPRALLLSALFTWLWNELRDIQDNDTGAPIAGLTGPRLLAVWIYTYAWRALFDADAASPDASAEQRARLGQLLQVLLQRWCAGYHYLGAHCEPGRHGVILGCVDIDAKGTLSRLDVMECRRHVLTGPLLHHWGGQFGLAPVDLVANRLFRAICCTSGLESFFDLPALPGLTADYFIHGSDGAEHPDFGAGATMLSDSAFLLYGPPSSTGARLEEVGISIVERHEVGLPGFIAKLLSVLALPSPIESSGPTAGPLVYARYSLRGENATTPHLMVAIGRRTPAAGRAVTGQPGRLEGFVIDVVRGVPLRPFARSAVVRFSVALMNELPIASHAQLRNPEADEWRAVADGFAGSGLGTVHDVAELDADDVRGRVLGVAPPEGNAGKAAVVALEQVLADIDATITSYTKAAAEAVPPAGMFDRASLLGPAYLKKVVVNLPGEPFAQLKLAAVTAAAKAAQSGP